MQSSIKVLLLLSLIKNARLQTADYNELVDNLLTSAGNDRHLAGAGLGYVFTLHPNASDKTPFRLSGIVRLTNSRVYGLEHSFTRNGDAIAANTSEGLILNGQLRYSVASSLADVSFYYVDQQSQLVQVDWTFWGVGYGDFLADYQFAVSADETKLSLDWLRASNDSSDFVYELSFTDDWDDLGEDLFNQITLLYATAKDRIVQIVAEAIKASS